MKTTSDTKTIFVHVKLMIFTSKNQNSIIINTTNRCKDGSAGHLMKIKNESCV